MDKYNFIHFYQLAFFKPKKYPLLLNSINDILETLNFLWIDLERPVIIQKFLIWLLKFLYLIVPKTLLNIEKKKRLFLKIKRNIFIKRWINSVFMYKPLFLMSLVCLRYCIFNK